VSYKEKYLSMVTARVAEQDDLLGVIERLSAELAEAKAEIKALKQNYSYRLEQIEAIQQVIGTEFARAKALRGGE
jgi:hypothetical protein